MVATAPHVLVVPAKVPATKVEDLVRLARASPGKLSYASAGVGTTFHFCAEMFKDSTGTFILHVPYRGGGPALLDTLAGQVDMSFPTLSAALPHVKAGTLRALAVTDTTRSSLLPEVPTLREAGVKDFQFTQWLALLAPAGTPRRVVARAERRVASGARPPGAARTSSSSRASTPSSPRPKKRASSSPPKCSASARSSKARKITAEVSMDLGLKDKKVLITGGSKGIGLACAQGLHRRRRQGRSGFPF